MDIGKCNVCATPDPKKVVCIDCYDKQVNLVKLLALKLRESQGLVLTARVANSFLREVLESQNLIPPQDHAA